MYELVPLIWEKNFKPRPQNRILVPLGGSQGIKVFRGVHRPSCVPLPTWGFHVAIFTHFAKRQISTYLIQWPIVTQPSFPE